MKFQDIVRCKRRELGLTQAGRFACRRKQMGKWSFPKLKKLPTNPRLHYFQYKIKDLLEVSLWLRT